MNSVSGQGGATSCGLCGAAILGPEGVCPSCQETRPHSPHDIHVDLPPASLTIPGYRILRRIGAGGMGTVLEALDERMNRRVALKIFSQRLAESHHAADRFTREAWIAGRLTHAHLVKVYERGESEGLLYYSMELVEGCSLAHVVANLRRSGRDEEIGLEFAGRQYIPWAITQVVSAARGLHHAHLQNVIHRDIKPANILFDRNERTVKIADFGLAVDLAVTRLTTEGKVLGTVAYMAPEQIRGRHEEIGAKTDVYSLGVTLFEMVTLELPYTGETQQLYMNAVLTSAARRASRLNDKVARDLEIVLRKALEKNPADRYPSAAAFADDLENVLQLRPITAKPPSFPARLFKWARRRPIHAALAAVLVLGLPTVSILGVRTAQHQRLLQRMEVEERWREARMLLHSNRMSEALTRLDRVLAADSTHQEALTARALAYKSLARAESEGGGQAALWERALADASRLIEVVPTASSPHRLKAYLLRLSGAAGNPAEEEAAAARLASGRPTDFELGLDAILAEVGGDRRRAVDLLKTLIDRTPDSADARLRRAVLYGQMGDIGRAETDFEVAIALMPGDPTARFFFGELLTERGELARGGEMLRRAVEIDPNNDLSHEALADNLIKQGKQKAETGEREKALALLRDAESAARRSIEINPDAWWSHLNLGASLAEQGRLTGEPDGPLLEQAIAQYRTVISAGDEGRLDPKDDVYSSALKNLCDALIQVRDLGSAPDICSKVTELRPSDQDAFYNLAGALSLLGRADEALAALQRDFELGDRDFEYMQNDDWFAPLRADNRFIALLQKMKEAAPAR